MPDTTPDELATVHRFARELLDRRKVSDRHYAETVALLSEPGVVELVMLLGYYTLIAMTLNVFQVPLPAGQTSPFDAESE